MQVATRTSGALPIQPSKDPIEQQILAAGNSQRGAGRGDPRFPAPQGPDFRRGGDHARARPARQPVSGAFEALQLSGPELRRATTRGSRANSSSDTSRSASAAEAFRSVRSGLATGPLVAGQERLRRDRRALWRRRDLFRRQSRALLRADGGADAAGRHQSAPAAARRAVRNRSPRRRVWSRR